MISFSAPADHPPPPASGLEGGGGVDDFPAAEAGPSSAAGGLPADLNLSDDGEDDDDFGPLSGLMGEAVSDDDFDLSNSGSNSRFVDGSVPAAVMDLNTPEIDLEGAINSIMTSSSSQEPIFTSFQERHSQVLVLMTFWLAILGAA